MNWTGQKVKSKNTHGCFEIVNSMFRTAVHSSVFVLFRLVTRLKHGSSNRGYNSIKMISKGDKKNFKSVGGSSYRGFELPRVKLLTVNV